MNRRGQMQIMTILLWLLLGCLGCPDEPPPEEPTPVKSLSLEELQDPKSCQACHQQHYEEWSASMHAYASKDPVFLAMNKRGQRETNGELGSFCVQCHAPMALRTGATTDATDVEDDEPGSPNAYATQAFRRRSCFASQRVLLSSERSSRQPGGRKPPSTVGRRQVPSGRCTPSCSSQVFAMWWSPSGV